VSTALANNSEFWVRFANQLDHQGVRPALPTSEAEGLRRSDRYLDDIAIYGVTLYQQYAFTIMLVGAVRLFVLVAAIVLCQED
jgi:NADH:ubiquinone oxidoreductase subunit 6 (subunit J)